MLKGGNMSENKYDITNQWLDLNGACKMMNLSKSTLRRYINRNLLKCSKKTGKVLIRVSDIVAFLD